MKEDLIAILQSALWGSPLNKKIKITPRLMEVLHQQCLETIVAQTLLQLPHTEKLEHYLLQLVAATMKQHNRVNKAIKELAIAFEREGIPCILLKGQVCASYYPNPLLRPSGDIDIYSKANYQEGKQILLRLASHKEKHEDVKHFCITINNIDIELHQILEKLTTPKQDKKYRQIANESMNNNRLLVIDGTNVYIPSIQINILIVFIHLWQHLLVGGVGIRQYIDLAYILHKDHEDIDKDNLHKYLIDLNLLYAWELIGNVLVNYLGLKKEEFPFFNGKHIDEAKKLIALTLKEGNLGKTYKWAEETSNNIKKHICNSIIRIGRIPKLYKISPTLALHSLLRMGNDFFKL